MISLDVLHGLVNLMAVLRAMPWWFEIISTIMAMIY